MHDYEKRRLDVLKLIHENPGILFEDIEITLHMRESYVSMAIGYMQDKGWIRFEQEKGKHSKKKRFFPIVSIGEVKAQLHAQCIAEAEKKYAEIEAIL